MTQREEFEEWFNDFNDEARLDAKDRELMFVSWQAAKEQVAPQWIPVNDPPKEIGRYWCYVEEQNDIGVSHYQWNCSWNCEEWGSEGLTGVVTHWMPLPAAPVQAKDGE